EVIAKGAPYLGICLGLQALFEASEEAPGAAGLAVLAGSVKRLLPAPGIKIPHMGWNEVAPARAHPVIGGAAVYYFVHSYHAVPSDPSLVAATSDHGAVPITAAIAKDNVIAVQFHPEKSQAVGLALLARWFRD